MPTKKSRRKDRFDATLDLFESRCPKSTPTQPLPATAPPIQDPLAGFDLKIQEVLEQELKSAATKELPPACDPHQPPADPYPEQKDWIPARMLNEFVYCQRLFFYEHVEGLFVDNSDTTRGRTLHKRVDSGSGALPTPEAVPEGQQIHSRSVSLGSERLGVTAKLDLVESSADRTVIPVDYKIGAPREDADGLKLWPTDRMQLGLQILLLRDNGYSCSEGFIYYRATKQRVSLLHSADLESWVLGQIDAARSTARGQIPPPLVASEKCTRCSLNSICLPDETRQLAQPLTEDQAPTAMPRRLIAPREDSRVLYLNTPGLRIGRKDGLLVVKEEKRVLDEIRIHDITHVSLFGNIQISTQAVHTLCEAEIPITYFSMGGWFYGITRGHGLKNIFTRIEQFRLAGDSPSCLRLARQCVFGKIRNQRTLLMRLHTSPPDHAILKLKRLAESAKQAQCLQELLGTEGAAAATYFAEFNGMIKAEDDIDLGHGPPPPAFRFDFAGRNRRPPTDPVNALLSLAYSLLAKDCTLAATAVGFDPYLGFYHQPRFGRPALALDIMEEFRPLIAESAVLTCINNGMLQSRHFVRAGKAVNLTPEGRKIFFQVYEQRISALITHPIFDYKVSYRRVIELQFRLLARFLTAEIPDYPPFLTR